MFIFNYGNALCFCIGAKRISFLFYLLWFRRVCCNIWCWLPRGSSCAHFFGRWNYTAIEFAYLTSSTRRTKEDEHAICKYIQPTVLRTMHAHTRWLRVSRTICYVCWNIQITMRIHTQIFFIQSVTEICIYKLKFN